MTAEHRERFEMLGENRVRMMLREGTMVWHLTVPAYEWLSEIEAKAKEPDNAPAQGT